VLAARPDEWGNIATDVCWLPRFALARAAPLATGPGAAAGRTGPLARVRNGRTAHPLAPLRDHSAIALPGKGIT